MIVFTGYNSNLPFQIYVLLLMPFPPGFTDLLFHFLHKQAILWLCLSVQRIAPKVMCRYSQKYTPIPPLQGQIGSSDPGVLLET